MGNKNNPYVNIGSRGLTSEMHYGNCFWDTEIFILPFFIFSDPDTAKALVKYRYFTLPAARTKAKQLWFKGQMHFTVKLLLALDEKQMAQNTACTLYLTLSLFDFNPLY